MRIQLFAAVCAPLLLVACGGYFETPTSTVVVRPHEVIDSVKCGLAKALSYDRLGRTGLRGSTAAVEMGVNMVLGTTAEGKLEVGIPIVAGGVPGMLTPTLGASYSDERKTNTTIKFNVGLSAPNVAICRHAAVGHDAGFSAWIGAVVTSVNLAVAGEPKASMQFYEYETDFTVKQGGSAGISAEIVPVKASGSTSASRSDIQHLKITIKPVHCVRGKDGKPTCKPGGGPFFVPIP